MNHPRSSLGWGILAGVSVGLVALFGLIFIAIATSSGDSSDVTGERIGVVELSGAITDEGASGLLGGQASGARRFMTELEKAHKDDSVKAIVIRVNSPGGSAAASQEMYEAVQRVRKNKPVVCSMGDVAASGGYYVAAACDQIYANGSTLTGSIGVISQFLNYGQLFRKLGLDEATIKSGRFKDAGNPSRPLTLAERQLFQQMIMDVYNQFVDDIAKGRKGKLTRQQILKLADGRVYTGRQAKANKLIDNIGGLHDAVNAAAKLVNLSGEPKTKNFSQRSGVLGSVFGTNSDASLDASLQQMSASAGAAAGESFAQTLSRQLKEDGRVPTIR